MEIICPRCGSDDCYHNGVCYECNDCGYEWGDDDTPFDDN